MGQRQDSQMPASGAAAPDGTFAERLRVSDSLIEQNVQRITHQARLMMEEGRSEIRMRLDPPHLGRLSLRMTLENGQIHGRILVERHEAQRLLQDAIPALRQTLHAQGVDVQTMDVQLRDHGSATDPNGRFVQPDTQSDDSQREWERHRQEDTPEWKQFRKRRDGYRGQKFEQFA
jgi:flagellar hook-length control protein FliK